MLHHILTETRKIVPPLEGIPSATRQCTPGTLVRARVMVQEIGDPECFVAEASRKDGTGFVSGLFRDFFEDVVVQEPLKLMERLPVYCVPVPGRSAWTGPAAAGAAALSASASPADRGRRGAKRPKDDEGDVDMGAGDGRGAGEGPAARAAPGGRAAAEDRRPAGSVVPDLNFPLPGETGTPFLIKFYGNQAAEVRMCDVLEVVGVVSHPADEGLADDGALEEGDGFEALADAEHHTLPAALVPRLHAISVARVGCLHPDLPVLGSPERDALVSSMSPAAVAEVRSQVLGALARGATQGDALAAEYVLLHLLSRTHATKMGVKVGRLSLNIHSKELDAAAIGEAYRALSPAAHVAPMSLEYLNSSRAAPVMDHGRNRLLSGLLQLPSSSFLLLDETAMTEGTLQARGIQNIQALSHAIRTGEVEYDYVFHKISMDADFVVGVLSQAPSKFLPCDLKVRLAPSQPNASASEAWDPSAQRWLADARSYLALVRHLPFSVPEDVGKLITEDFVQARQENPQLDPQTLGLWLTLARLRAASFGESVLSEQRWRELRDLENTRMARN